MLSIVTLFFVITISILITKVAAALLVHTGLSRDMARFQARSAFTGAGFTTTESENVVGHPLRRKIAGTLMILGNAGLVSAVSTLIIGFVDKELSTGIFQFFMLALAVSAVMYLVQTRWFERQLGLLVSWLMQRTDHLELSDYASLLNVSGDYRVAEMEVEQGHWMVGKSLREMKLNHEGVIVLGIHRHNGEYLGIPRGHTKINDNETLVLYGKDERINDLRERTESHGDERARQSQVEHARDVREAEREDAENQAEAEREEAERAAEVRKGPPERDNTEQAPAGEDR